MINIVALQTETKTCNDLHRIASAFCQGFRRQELGKTFIYYSIFCSVIIDDSFQCFIQILELIQEAILATDLALFFGNKAKLDKTIDNNTFSWNNPEHRLVAVLKNNNLLLGNSLTKSDFQRGPKLQIIKVKHIISKTTHKN